MFLLSLAALIYIVLLRLRQNLDDALDKRVRERWDGVFNSIQQDRAYQLPALKKNEREALLGLWLEERSLAAEAYGARLDKFGLELGLDKTICRILRPTSLKFLPDRVWLLSQAVTAARHIDTPDTRKYLRLMTESDNPSLASGACAALLEVGAENTERLIITTLFGFPQRLPFFISQLGESGAARILHSIEAYFEYLPEYVRFNFIALSEFTRDETLLPMLSARLQHSDEPEEICALLRAIGNLGGAGQRDLIRKYFEHENRFVRLNAGKALANVGTVEDRDLLLPMLADYNWSVRYRAAKSYVELTGDDEEHINHMIGSLEDKFAREILAHAYAEKYWCLG